MNAALRALNRFGLGARPAEGDRITDPRRWLQDQLDGDAPLLTTPSAAAPAAIAAALSGLRMRAQANARERREARRRLVEISAAEVAAALTARVASERPYVERLVAFWSNHLCISAGAKVIVAPLAGSYERDAIRPHVLGRFEDMVLASARHPAMLAYLDNFQSIGPRSRAARLRRGNAQRGLNENYARELLELHTLGVNGGYTQQDVQELARLLTGWTVRGLGAGPFGARAASGDEIRFSFEELLHEPGSKTVLGVRYGDGEAEGERALRNLCRHPATARFLATKLVTHFVSDDPPARAVEGIANVFAATRGDLRAVAQALIDVPAAWNENARKFRTPQDWVTAVLRGSGVGVGNEQVGVLLRQLRQPLWSPPSPQGFSDELQDWADPDALLNRAELARTLGGRAELRRLDPSAMLSTIEADDALSRLVRDDAITAGERFALLAASPAFQWR